LEAACPDESFRRGRGKLEAACPDESFRRGSGKFEAACPDESFRRACPDESFRRGSTKHEARSLRLAARIPNPEERTGHWSLVINYWLQVTGYRSQVNAKELKEDKMFTTHYSLLTTKSLKLRKNSSKPEARSPKLLTKIKNQNIIAISLTPLLWRGRERLQKYNQCNALYLPLNFKVCKKTFEGLSLLPRGSAGIGAIPGAAAITTIISFFYSSPRDALKIAETRHLARFLPVINQSTFHQGSFVPLSRGTRFALSNQGVKETIPNNWIEGTKLERRYLTK
jgi:hypothetical protein